MNIYAFNDYRNYLRSLSGGRKERTGFKTSLAKAANCFNSYVSKVLNDQAHFTLEQAEAISEYLGHNKNQKKFFFLLVQRDRAGTTALKKHFTKEIEVERESALNLKNQMPTEFNFSAETESRYYSHWLYSAVDLALTVAGLNSGPDLARYLGVSLAKINQVVEFLVETGVVQEKQGKLQTTANHIHLASNSANIIKHHTNWRLKALESIDNLNENNLHYSSSVTVSDEDFVKIKELLVECLKNTNKVVDTSHAQNLFAINVDLFRVSNSTKT